LIRVVIDASVAVKWFLPEEHSEDARSLLRSEHQLLAPELIYIEVGGVLRKRLRAGEIQDATALNVLVMLQALRLDIHTMRPLIEAAWRVSTACQISFYNSVYLALAVARDAQVVTADRRLYNSVRASDLRAQILWIAEKAA
jgi:predicted nucleic acid-binding protein